MATNINSNQFRFIKRIFAYPVAEKKSRECEFCAFIEKKKRPRMAVKGNLDLTEAGSRFVKKHTPTKVMFKLSE